MTIKSDHWIRRMGEQGMISPFEPGQIRQDAAGNKIVSYGTSSYGYDIRCADDSRSLPTSIALLLTRRISMNNRSLISKAMFASFHRIHLH